MLPDPAQKCKEVSNLQVQLNTSDLPLQPTATIEDIKTPGRPAKPNLVTPQEVPRRSLVTATGRAALIHAITHIEFNAINLALDAAYRFQDQPARYYYDWIHVANEEAQHFSMLRARLQQLHHDYGDFDAHNGLWEMAQKTNHSMVARMALIPRVLEAKGLDVTPGMILRLRQHGEQDTANILEVIFGQEIGHVAIGTHWFQHACKQQGLVPDATFQALLKQYFSGGLRGPFQIEARRKAGFSQTELDVIQNI